VGNELSEVQLFVRGPVVVFKWKNADGWPVEYASLNTGDTFGYTPQQFLDGEVSYASVVHAEDLDRVAAEVQEATKGSTSSFEHEPYRIIHRDGSIRWLYDLTHLVRKNGEVTHFVGYVIDITRRIEAEQEARSLEHQLLQAQRLESLGMLAGGVAHDFNNILTGILGEANLARRVLSKAPDTDVSPNVERIELLALRAADLTRQLLAYSGKGRFVVLPVDLSHIVDDMATMLGVVISKKAALSLELDDGLPAIEGDRAQLQQIVMNLITNASDALGAEPGEITVRTGTAECTREMLADTYGERDLAPGRFVTLEVTDTGCGMPEEVRSHVFEPFFTTKASGRGLGMSAILGIVRSHGGAIQLTSSPGDGTTFRLLFPACAEAAIPVGQSERPGGWKGQGLALIVDDEPSVRLVASRMLEQLGFDTVTATEGQQALEVYRERRDEIVVVLMDMMMPVMGGAEAIEALRRLTPNLPIIMSSGFDEAEITTRLAGLPATTFLQKPYQVSDVEGALRAVLDPAGDEVGVAS